MDYFYMNSSVMIGPGMWKIKIRKQYTFQNTRYWISQITYSFVFSTRWYDQQATSDQSARYLVSRNEEEV